MESSEQSQTPAKFGSIYGSESFGPLHPRFVYRSVQVQPPTPDSPSRTQHRSALQHQSPMRSPPSSPRSRSPIPSMRAAGAEIGWVEPNEPAPLISSRPLLRTGRLASSEQMWESPVIAALKSHLHHDGDSAAMENRTLLSPDRLPRRAQSFDHATSPPLRASTTGSPSTNPPMTDTPDSAFALPPLIGEATQHDAPPALNLMSMTANHRIKNSNPFFRAQSAQSPPSNTDATAQSQASTADIPSVESPDLSSPVNQMAVVGDQPRSRRRARRVVSVLPAASSAPQSLNSPTRTVSSAASSIQAATAPPITLPASPSRAGPHHPSAHTRPQTTVTATATATSTPMNGDAMPMTLNSVLFDLLQPMRKRLASGTPNTQGPVLGAGISRFHGDNIIIRYSPTQSAQICRLRLPKPHSLSVVKDTPSAADAELDKPGPVTNRRTRQAANVIFAALRANLCCSNRPWLYSTMRTIQLVRQYAAVNGSSNKSVSIVGQYLTSPLGARELGTSERAIVTAMLKAGQRTEAEETPGDRVFRFPWVSAIRMATDLLGLRYQRLAEYLARHPPTQPGKPAHGEDGASQKISRTEHDKIFASFVMFFALLRAQLLDAMQQGPEEYLSTLGAYEETWAAQNDVRQGTPYFVGPGGIVQSLVSPLVPIRVLILCANAVREENAAHVFARFLM